MEKEVFAVYKKHKIKSYISVSSIVTIHYFEFTKDYRYEGERHDFWEMVYVDKGNIIADADGAEVSLCQGEAIFHKPGEFHSLRSDGLSAPNVFVISFVTESEAMSVFEGRKMTIPKEYRRLITDIIAESQLTYSLPVFDSNLTELRLRRDAIPGGAQIIKMRIEELLISLSRSLAKSDEVSLSGGFASTVAKNGRAFPEDPDEEFSKKIIHLIKQHGIYGKVNLETICQRINYGKTYVCTRFRKITSYSVMEYANIMKITEAKRLIREKNHNFTQISNMLGFNNPHYFSKVFHKVTGMSPREYLKSVNK